MARQAMVALAALALLACGSRERDTSEPVHFPEQALASVPSNSGKLRVELRTAPEQPPTHGVVSAELRLIDASTGERVPDVSLVVTPWMPAMGHGTSTAPSTTETEPGAYLVDPIGAYMPGTWELLTDISGAVPDHVDLSLEIQ